MRISDWSSDVCSSDLAIAMQAIYTASKHAVAGLTRNAAVDYAASGLRINAVCPGGIHTPMLEQTLKSAGAERDAVLQSIAELHPMNRVGPPEEIAQMVVFLMSEHACFIKGLCNVVVRSEKSS